MALRGWVVYGWPGTQLALPIGPVPRGGSTSRPQRAAAFQRRPRLVWGSWRMAAPDIKSKGQWDYR